MPFRLKNTGATYQRLVNRIFKDQLGKTMEAYVDDMLVKSLVAEQHCKDLRETFELLRQYHMKLNPSKCVFSVSVGKFLGFMVTRRGIEANPDKIRVLLEMEAPRTKKEIQILTGRIASLSRFISCSGDKGLPFFKSLQKKGGFKWGEEQAKAFELLKQYLRSPPLLTKAKNGEDLYLYIASTESAVSSVLVREEGRKHQPIYYTSKVLSGAEKNYCKAEKAAFSIVCAVRKIEALLSGPQTERFSDSSTKSDVWTLHVDGSSNAAGGGAGFILSAPDGTETLFELKLEFTATNNDAEYEALLASLRLAEVLGVAQIKDGSLPEDNKEARKVRRKAARYTLIGRELYRRSLTLPYLRCLNDEEGTYVLREIHEGVCGNHLASRALAHKAMRQGFYWPTMKKDAVKLVKKLVCRYGIPWAIVTDHGKRFDNDCYKKFCSDLIKLLFASVAHPQSNGQVENMNQTILHGLRTRLESMQGRWAEELPSLIWAYHTTKRAATGETPFMLVFGAEAIILAEVGIPSWRRQYFNEQTNNKELRSEIDLLEERQDQASLKVAAYQQRVAKFYNNRVKVRNFQAGDLVLRKTRNNPSESGSHKLKPNWEGPYRVTIEIKPGTYKLEDVGGKEIKNTWNSGMLKKYYSKKSAFCSAVIKVSITKVALHQ
ncbi:uncharacterized protein LOC131163516 [Malania oleifera]|uniref:uncharacterized protein LOC131163516 n=1 Tax=Malania oleifera TaxID=397392 RepID=UPI0025AE5282|nr:uncharacterized protein LOC131163516 [Malania oleifera]